MTINSLNLPQRAMSKEIHFQKVGAYWSLSTDHAVKWECQLNMRRHEPPQQQKTNALPTQIVVQGSFWPIGIVCL